MNITEDGDREAATPAQARRLRARLERLNKRANSGDTKALAELEAFLRKHPDVLAAAGDLAKHAEKAWIDLVVGSDSFTRVAVTSQFEQLKRELAGPGPSPLEKLLVDHVAVTHLAERQAELTAAQIGRSLQQAAFRLKKAESAQKRFLAATKLLANLRAMQPRSNRPLEPLKLFDPKGRKTA